jgi:hypothetical protein
MIKLFVNGDSHTASSYHDPDLTATKILAEKYQFDYINIAQAGGSNQRIMRTTLASLPDLDPASTLIVIGWSSFERTEWFYQGQWHQITDAAIYQIENDLRELGRQHTQSWYNPDNYECWNRQAEQHNAIWNFHKLLHQLGYQFIFYQGCKTFFFDGCPQQDMEFKLPWIDQVWAHDPYVRLTRDNERVIESFSHYVEQHGCQHIDDYAHFGTDAHELWATYLDPLVKDKIHELEKRNSC